MAKFLTSIDLQKNQLVRARVENLASDPSSPVAGQLYFNTVTGRLRYYSGTAWIELDAAVESITVDAPLSTTVDGTSINISIAEATASADGYMSLEYAALLDTATATNTNNSLVKRDGSGNFSAGTITADLAGNADTASTLETGRTIELTGEVTGSVVFDGSGDVQISTTIQPDTVALGTDTTGDYVESIDVSGVGLSIDFSSGEGVNPTITSNATDANTPGTVVSRDASGNFSAGTITADLTGDVTGEVSSLANHDTDDLAEGTTNLYFTDARVQANTLDSLAAPVADVDLNNKKIENLADPVNPQDAATKAYVDAARAGLDVKDSVYVATTENITLSGTQTIDGVSVPQNVRVLVKNQTNAGENGIYVVKSGAWERATDADGSTDLSGGSFTFVENGTANDNSGWVCTNTGSVVTSMGEPNYWAQFSGAGQITAGAGLTKTGNTIDAVGTDNRITVNADSIDIASTYIGQSSITTLGTITTGTWNGSVIPVAYGGTNASTALGARQNLGATTKYATTLTGDGATTSYTVTHNLDTLDVTVGVYDTLSGNNDIVYPEIRISTNNTVTIMFDQAPLGGGSPQTYRVVVIG
jgi:hypothetical protein